jgi:hypothetical protein
MLRTRLGLVGFAGEVWKVKVIVVSLWMPEDFRDIRARWLSVADERKLGLDMRLH